MRTAATTLLTVTLGAFLIWFIVGDNKRKEYEGTPVDGIPHSQLTDSHVSDNRESGVPAAAEDDHSTNLEPVRIHEWRMSRGYHRGSSNDSGSKHPYQYYDLDALSEMANNDDGLAQLILAERIPFSTKQKERAIQLYWQAAINGYTAALINTATDSMVLKPGSSSYDFPIKNDDGEVSDEYAERLKYFAAAEYLNDFVGTVSLQMHMDPPGLSDSSASRNRICQLGLELAQQIRNERIKKSGNAEWPIQPDMPQSDISVEIPAPYCSPKADTV